MNEQKSRKHNIKVLWAKIGLGIGLVSGIFAILDKLELLVNIFKTILDFIYKIYPIIIFLNFIILFALFVKILKDKNKIINEEKIDDLEKICNRLEESNQICCLNMRNFENVQAKMRAFGISDIYLREDRNNNFYKNIYSNTTKTLIISGHSLNNTINRKKAADLRNVLKNAMIRVLRNGGTVKILLQATISNNEISIEKRRWFNEFVKELVDDIILTSDKEKWTDVKSIEERLLIKQIDDLRYLVIQTDTTTLISYYKMGRSNDNSNICIFRVDPDEKFGTSYLEDFNYIFDKCANFIEESMEQLNRLTIQGKAL